MKLEVSCNFKKLIPTENKPRQSAFGSSQVVINSSSTLPLHPQLIIFFAVVFRLESLGPRITPWIICIYGYYRIIQVEGPLGVRSPTPCSRQGQLWGQTRRLGASSSLVLEGQPPWATRLADQTSSLGASFLPPSPNASFFPVCAGCTFPPATHPFKEACSFSSATSLLLRAAGRCQAPWKPSLLQAEPPPVPQVPSRGKCPSPWPPWWPELDAQESQCLIFLLRSQMNK